MMRTRTTVAAALGAAALAVLLAGCQSGGSPGGSPGSGAAPAGVPLTIGQIQALLAGNSVVATATDGGSSCAFHSTETHTSNSMIVSGVQQGGATPGPFRGFYRVEPFSGAAGADDPGLICYSYPDAGVFADCRQVRQSGAIAGGTGIALYDRSGSTLRATGTVQPGNSCGSP